MAPTTATLVREELAALIVALPPPTLTPPVPQPFRRYTGSKVFRDYIGEQSAAHALRQFNLRFAVSQSPPTTNGDIDRWLYDFTFEIGYPRVHYKGATTPVIGVDEIVDADQRLIYRVFREETTDATWVLEGDKFSDPETEEVGEVRIVRYGARYEIHRDMR